MQLGGAKPFRARTTLNALAGATFAYCLKQGSLNLTRANLHSGDSAFKSLDSGASVNLGGVLLKDPDGSIEDLSITVDRIANTGSVSGKNIQLAGSHVSRMRDPNSPNDVAFEAMNQTSALGKDIWAPGTKDFSAVATNAVVCTSFGDVLATLLVKPEGSVGRLNIFTHGEGDRISFKGHMVLDNVQPWVVEEGVAVIEITNSFDNDVNSRRNTLEGGQVPSSATRCTGNFSFHVSKQRPKRGAWASQTLTFTG